MIFFLTNMTFPNWGEGGCPRLGKNYHIFPFFFFWGASLSALIINYLTSAVVAHTIHSPPANW